VNLYILRHAIAAHPGDPGMAADLSDFDRPLTTEGRRKLRRSVAGMKANGVRFDHVVTSPLIRAAQTAGIVVKAMSLPKEALVVSAHLAPGGDRRELIREVNELASVAENIVLVGHEPDLGKLVGLLCSGSTAASIKLKKGGLAKLESGRLRHGRCATLAWLLSPKQLRLVGRD
jgi:phosphohistidine phosphatase